MGAFQHKQLKKGRRGLRDIEARLGLGSSMLRDAPKPQEELNVPLLSARVITDCTHRTEAPVKDAAV